MNNEIKEAIKSEIEKQFYEDCIEELENRDFEQYYEYLDEMIWEEFDFELRDYKDEVEEMFEDLREEYLEGKRDDAEEERQLRIWFQNAALGR